MTAPSKDQIETAVSHWFQEQVACGAVGQHTPAYNQMVAAKADLHSRIGLLFDDADGDIAQSAPVDAPVVQAVTGFQPLAAPAATQE